MTPMLRTARAPQIEVTVTAVRPPRRPTGPFDRWIAASISPRSTVLNVGAGSDLSGHLWDLPSLYLPYLPSRASGLAHGWHRLAYRWDWPGVMGHLTFRATR